MDEHTPNEADTRSICYQMAQQQQPNQTVKQTIEAAKLIYTYITKGE